MQKLKKTVSILLVFMMIVSLFAIVPITASAEVGDFVAEEDYLTFTAVEAGSTVTLNVASGNNNLQYGLNGNGLTGYTAGTTITLANEGDYVRFRGKDTTFNGSKHVSIDGEVACSGNVMSLRLDDYGEVQGLSDSCFNYMFKDCTGLTAAPKLPETILAPYCYYNMFYGCRSLTTAPELPATTLAPNCYYNMFSRCERLTTAPKLPATSLARYCYSNMFARCTNLTTAPKLPATTLAENCYYNMFSGCTRLTTAPELPATTLAYECYSYMFNGCTSLTTAPELPATTLMPSCYSAMFAGCSSIKLSETQTDEYRIPYSVPSGGNGTPASSALDYMFDDTGGTFTGTPEINKTYYRPPQKYTVTDESVNGTVTASVNDTDVTEAAQDDAVLLNVAPAEGYQFKSITATCAKNGVEEFSDLVALMGDAVADGCDGVFDGYTFKVEDGEFVIYNGSTLFAELSESDVTDFQVGDETYVESGDEGWYFTLSDNKITEFCWENNTTGDYFFTNDFESTGTLPLAELALTTVTEGSQYSFTMPNKPVTVTAEFEAIPTYTVTWKNGDTVLETDTDVAEGTTPTYDGTTPTKAEDENNTYTFAGWSPAIAPVTEDVTYTAQFDATPKTPAVGASYVKVTSEPDDWSGDYLIVYEDEDGSTAFNGSADELNSSGNYIDVTISNGEIESDAATDAAKVTIVQIDGGYSIKAANKYIGGTSGSSKNIAISDEAIVNMISLDDDDYAVIESNSKYFRYNTSWSGFRYYASGQQPVCLYKYTEPDAPTGYTVTWQNEDGTTLETDTDVEEGATPTYDGETPTKAAADGDHMYVFSGWTPELAPVTEDVTYTATFTSAVISERAADLVEITDHETDLADLGIDIVMSEWGRSMTAQEAITLAQYMSAQNDGAKCAVLYEVVDDYELQYAMSDGTTGDRTSFYSYTLNDFLPDYKVYYLPVNLNPETIELNLNPDNATVIWYDATTDSDGYWSMEAAYNNDNDDDCYLVLKGNSNQPAGTYEWADMGSGCGISDYDASQTINFVDGSCTVTVDEDVVTVSGTFTGRDRNTYVVTVTYEAPYYTITDESVNGAVTAGVNGADVTKAKAGKTVLLNVAPADGYRFKSITASAQKTIPEDFSDLVALMGDAVFDGDENYDCGGYTCKVENGKFVVYNGANLLAELSESNMTGFNSDSDYVEVNSEDALWAFYVKNGEITGIDVADTNDDYIFCAVSGSKSTGTLQPVQVNLTTVAEGSQYSFTMPAKNVTVKAEFEAIPAPAKLILNVGENGKVVMNNGTFGNATNASNITGISVPGDVPDSGKVIIADGHSVNLVEGGSINIAAGGEVSFYPSADNTGKITAIPDKGYICTGWYNGDTCYTTKDTIDYQKISEDMTLTAKFAPDLFPQHSITLGGNIGVNFYINSAAANFASASEATVKFTWDNGNYHEEVNLKELTPDGDGYYKATVDVVAAQMAHKIHAEVYLNGEKLEQTDDYSVKEYAETVYANPEAYDTKGKPDELKALVKALLNYGAMAQTVFYNSLKEHPALANTTVGDNGYAAVTAEQIGAAIKGESADLNAVATQLGAKYYTNSLIYLSKNTLRIYFTPTSYPGEIPNAGAYDGNLSGYYYYVDHANIPAAELDNQQTFTVGGTTFTFSALDYAKAVVESTKMEPEQQNLAKSLYLYNQAANAYFDAAPAPVHTHTPGEAVQENVVPASCTAAGSYDEVVYCSECHEELSRETKTIDMLAHTIVAVAEVPATTEADGVAAHYECSVCHKLFSDAEGNNETTAEALVIPQIVENVVDLSTLTKGYEAQDGDVLINALKGQKYIRIADGATIKLRNANITSLNNSSGVKIAGLTLLGDATIILEGTNTIRGGYEYCPGIHVPEGKTLTIDGTGSLDVSSNGRGFGCGIGSNDGTNCGNIVINGGNITAYAGTAAGIGAKSGSSCGNITINGGTVNATSGDYGAGIGSTLYGNSICGDITINGGIVNATAKYQGAGIGSGVSANCGNITITGGIVTAIGGENGAGIGSGERVSICGNILITGGTVTAKGGENAAGIGSGYTNSSCGTITITDTVTQVTATKGSSASNSIGAGSNSTCGDVTIADGANVTQN